MVGAALVRRGTRLARHIALRMIAAGLFALLAVPAAALLTPGLLHPTPQDDQRNLPPVYGPNGLGAFPSEGSMGTHGCAEPAQVADVAAGRFAAGDAVCLENARVVQADPLHRSHLFRIRAPDGAELDASISQRWWALGTPAEGMVVVVEGAVARTANGTWRIEPVTRWVDLTHPGMGVDAWHVSAGHIPDGTYVWVNRTTVFAVWRNNDGPNSIGDDHVQTGTACPTAGLTTETTPELFGIITAPPIGATIRVYGAVRNDEGHGWWEIHPIRAWEALASQDAAQDCPERLGESGFPPPGLPSDPLSRAPPALPQDPVQPVG